MSFREKRAWVSFVVMFLVAGFYFGHLVAAYVHVHAHGGTPDIEFLAYFALAALAVFLAAEIASYLFLKLLSPKEARTPRDEREILIDLRATRVAYIVLVALSFFGAFFIVHLHAHYAINWLIGNLVICFIVIAQLIKFAMQIYLHRRES